MLFQNQKLLKTYLLCVLISYKAFVNIIYGCDKFCTYCIVPYTRGRERSRKKEEVIKECQQLVADGYQEITLLGQNVNAYGKDLTDGTDFAELLEAVAKLGIPRLRFTTSHPWDFSSKMIGSDWQIFKYNESYSSSISKWKCQYIA